MIRFYRYIDAYTTKQGLDEIKSQRRIGDLTIPYRIFSVFDLKSPGADCKQYSNVTWDSNIDYKIGSWVFGKGMSSALLNQLYVIDGGCLERWASNRRLEVIKPFSELKCKKCKYIERTKYGDILLTVNTPEKVFDFLKNFERPDESYEATFVLMSLDDETVGICNYNSYKLTQDMYDYVENYNRQHIYRMLWLNANEKLVELHRYYYFGKFEE